LPDASSFSYIDISSVDNRKKEITEVKKVPVDRAPSRARQRVCKGDVLVSLTRPGLNAVALVPPSLDGSIASTGFDVLRAIEIDPEWIFSVVRSEHFVKEMSQRVQGALYPAIRPHDVRTFRFPLPPLPEQRHILSRISSFKGNILQAKEDVTAVLELIENLHQSLLESAFGGRLTTGWREAHSRVETAQELLDRIRARQKPIKPAED
jgi:type I restriction enzyme S subunit